MVPEPSVGLHPIEFAFLITAENNVLADIDRLEQTAADFLLNAGEFIGDILFVWDIAGFNFQNSHISHLTFLIPNAFL